MAARQHSNNNNKVHTLCLKVKGVSFLSVVLKQIIVWSINRKLLTQILIPDLSFQSLKYLLGISCFSLPYMTVN